jgi:hypothetical protein
MYGSTNSKYQLKDELYARYKPGGTGLPDEFIILYQGMWHDYVYWPIFYRWSWRDRLHGGFDSARDRVFFWCAFLKLRGFSQRECAHILAYHFGQYPRAWDKLPGAGHWLVDLVYKVGAGPTGWHGLTEGPKACIVALNGTMATIPQRTDLPYLRQKMMPGAYGELPVGQPAPDLGL